MKKCKHCGQEFISEWNKNRVKYCKPCRDSGIPNRDRNKIWQIKRKNEKKRGKIKRYEIGNPSQDDDILRFIRN